MPPSSQQNARFLRCRWTAWKAGHGFADVIMIAPAALIRCFPNDSGRSPHDLDLALSRDFDPSVADLPNVELITLESVRLAAPRKTGPWRRLRASWSLELAAFLSRQRSRTIDSAIVALRSRTMDVLDLEEVT